MMMPFRTTGQPLAADRGRDVALQATLRAFLDGTLTASQLETDLRAYAREFEAKPYRIRTANLRLEQVPQERQLALVEVCVRITGPAHAAFFKGELSAARAAMKIAPLTLIFPGFGLDPPNADAVSRQRADELMDAIGTFADAEK
jgi:hypothetical protein